LTSAVGSAYGCSIADEIRLDAERADLQEHRHPHEFVRARTETRYAEVRAMLGVVPEVARLRDSTQVREFIDEQRKVEAETTAHALKEHRVSADLLGRRAATGERARGGMDAKILANATGFRSDEALVAAAAVAWDHSATVWQRGEAERRYNTARDVGASRAKLEQIADEFYLTHWGRAERALGPDWQQHVEGYSGRSGSLVATEFGPDPEIKTCWKMNAKGIWYLDSCFPIRDKTDHAD
jgi:hypothetical protein